MRIEEEMSKQEILKMMRDGGIRICDEAIGKWMNPNYCRELSNDFRQERKLYFINCKEEIKKLYQEIRRILQDENTTE